MDSHGSLHVDNYTARTRAHMLFRPPHERRRTYAGTTFARRICIIAHTLAVTIAHSRDNYIRYGRAALVAQFRGGLQSSQSRQYSSRNIIRRIFCNREAPLLLLLLPPSSFVFFPFSIHYCAFIGLDPLALPCLSATTRKQREKWNRLLRSDFELCLYYTLANLF